ncbi:hypothetical protein [Bacillus weihaiensis]|uniref:hypothetical protein n=1 Tax=Bacillus weihaiensis TaxID=1547283 RepID=UPI002353B6F3|nr:hypothetical protein [Bacillus weihaiensis]
MKKGRKVDMNEFMTRVLWVDFINFTVNEEVIDFPKFSKLMKTDKDNDIQILVYERVTA